MSDAEAFLKHLWGCESFLLTVKSGKSRSESQYAQDSTAIQGFAHDMVLVTVICCPEIIATQGRRDMIMDADIPIKDVIQSVVE